MPCLPLPLLYPLPRLTQAERWRVVGRPSAARCANAVVALINLKNKRLGLKCC
jgi:hypothetical protein